MIRFLLGGIALGLIATSVWAADEEKPYGRVCVTVFDSVAKKEEPFKMSVAPKDGAIVRAHIDSSDKCTVLFAALTKDGKLANGWKPQLAEIREEFEELQLPSAPVTWDWTKPPGPFDFYICFLVPGAKEADEAKKLIAAMQGAKLDERLLAMQTNKLRELIGRLNNAKEKVNQAPAIGPEVGGVLRGTSPDLFEWRQFAKKANFAEGHPGVVILSSEARESNPAPAP